MISGMSSMKSPVIFVDAIIECTDCAHLIASLGRILDGSRRARLVVTSTPEELANDVLTFIQSYIERDEKLRHLPAAIETEIVDILHCKSNGG